MTVILNLLSDSGLPDQITVDSLPIVVGRSPDVDIVIRDRWVSRRHCEILRLNQAVMIRDLDSCHGTLVNEIRVKNTELNHGDKVQIGLSIFEVVFRSNVMDHPPCNVTADEQPV